MREGWCWPLCFRCESCLVFKEQNFWFSFLDLIPSLRYSSIFVLWCLTWFLLALLVRVLSSVAVVIHFHRAIHVFGLYVQASVPMSIHRRQLECFLSFTLWFQSLPEHDLDFTLWFSSSVAGPRPMFVLLGSHSRYWFWVLASSLLPSVLKLFHFFLFYACISWKSVGVALLGFYSHRMWMSLPWSCSSFQLELCLRSCFLTVLFSLSDGRSHFSFMLTS
jgi:hypothetical protein